jgi:hypothetical protein
MDTIHVIGGGTFFDIRNHLSLAVRAKGTTARAIAAYLQEEIVSQGKSYDVKLHLTYMADDNRRDLISNADVSALVDRLIADPSTKGIVMNCALVDFEGSIDGVVPSKYAERLESREGDRVIQLTPADKLVGRIRQTRKDIFAVAFKTTCMADDSIQYQKGLKLLKQNSLNLVVANDTGTHRNMIVTPEESRYAVGDDRQATLRTLAKMMVARMNLTFTRSTVVESPGVSWSDSRIPSSLRYVVDGLIDAGAYKPFLGKTAGHFAVRDQEGAIFTSRRKTDFNRLSEIGMIQIQPVDADTIVAYGGKPSVGGQSQRIIFQDHPDLDCIAHAHVPLKTTGIIPVREQWPYECGSHECGRNTSQGLKEIEPGIWAVYLENHGPNVVFNRNVDGERVLRFMDRHFDLSGKTGGVFDANFSSHHA